jgi:hypothetical protein
MKKLQFVFFCSSIDLSEYVPRLLLLVRSSSYCEFYVAYRAIGGYNMNPGTVFQ